MFEAVWKFDMKSHDNVG